VREERIHHHQTEGLFMSKGIDDATTIQPPCIWKTNEDGYDTSVESGCGHAPYFEDEVTKEYLGRMGYKFCPYCGRVIIVESKQRPDHE